MNKIVSWLSLSLVGMACLLLSVLPAQALNARSWVSRSGLDTNGCTVTAPCLTFGGALAKTNPGGLINCLDAGDFGGGATVSITKSITIDCTGTFAGDLAPSGANGVSIDASATDVVRLRGLSIEGGGSGMSGGFVQQIGGLRIEQCKVFGFGSFGIYFIVDPGVGSELYVSDSVISENGSAGGNAGILLRIDGTATARVSLSNVKLDNNRNGLIALSSPASSGQLSLSMRD